MKLKERVSKCLVMWLLLSLLLKCSVITFDTISLVPKVSYGEGNSALKEEGRSKV